MLQKFSSEKKAWTGALFKMSWILTPSAHSCTASMYSSAPSSLKEHALAANRELGEFFARNGGRMGHILIIDFFESSSIVDVVMRMNGIIN